MNAKAAVARTLACAASVAILAGCPSSYGFRGRVVASKNGGSVVRVVASEPTAEPSVADVTGLANARVTCDGCGEAPIAIDGEGQFFVALGTSYRTPKPIVLHVTAPGYAPIEVALKEPPHDSQLGYGLLVVVMRPQP